MGLNKKTLIRLGSVAGILILGFFIMFVLASTEKHSNKRDVEPEVRLVETQFVNFEDLGTRNRG